MPLLLLFRALSAKVAAAAIVAWEWLKKNWKWVLFPVGILLAILGFRRKPDVLAPSLVEADGVLEREDTKADIVKAQALADRDKKITEVTQKHDAVISKLTEEQRKEADSLQEDPEKLNAFLLDVGRDQRR